MNDKGFVYDILAEKCLSLTPEILGTHEKVDLCKHMVEVFRILRWYFHEIEIFFLFSFVCPFYSYTTNIFVRLIIMTERNYDSYQHMSLFLFQFRPVASEEPRPTKL